MNARIFSVVGAITLLAVTPGCSGMRNFFSGRGARCGLCNRGAQPTPGYDSPQPCAQPAPQAGCCPPANGCGTPMANATCSPSYGSAYSGGCGCGVSSDPYSSQSMEVLPMEGQVYTEGVIGNGTDSFQPRQSP